MESIEYHILSLLEVYGLTEAKHFFPVGLECLNQEISIFQINRRVMFSNLIVLN